MDLGIKISDGPLSHINLAIVNYDTVIHLATGAYGWWKARSRSHSLIDVLASEKGQLSSASTFNRNVYIQTQRNAQMRGVATHDGRLESLSLPKALTSMDGDPGVICLRALLTGLLCLFDVTATTSMIAEVIPGTLINYELEGHVLKVQGPLLSSLRQYISAVAVEEDSSTLRRTVMNLLGESLSNFGYTQPSEHMLRCDSITESENSMIIGLLKWILTSSHQRKWECYPTRSLLAWMQAFILSFLGFEITASFRKLDTPELYDAYISARTVSNVAVVFLVTCNNRDADPLQSMNADNDAGGLKPRLLPIKAIPWTAFRHLGCGDGRDSTKHLSDIWDYSFSSALAAFKTPEITRDGTILLAVQPGNETIHTCHKEVLRLWNPQLWKAVGQSMRQFVPVMSDVVEGVEKFDNDFFSVRRTEAIVARGTAAENWYCTSTIVLATVYAAACKSLRSAQDKGSDMHVEVAFPPDLIFSRKPHQWAVVVGGALNGVATSLEWTKMVMELCTAIEFPIESYNPNDVTGQRVYPSRAPPSFLDRFGAQANGILVVSDILLRPSLELSSLVTYHIEYGQCLHFPLDDHGFIRASTGSGRPIRAASLNPEPEFSILEGQKSNCKVRLDVEPDWDRDPRTVVLQARVDGIHRYTFSLLTVVERMPSQIVACQCSRNSCTLRVPSQQRWQPLQMSQLFISHWISYSAASRVSIESGNYVLIQAGGDVGSQLMCLGVMEGPYIVVAKTCLQCAYNQLFVNRLGQAIQPPVAILISGL